MTKVGAIVLAAGQGRRMGADKALLDLGGKTAIERVVQSCEAAGVEWLGIVRAAGAPALCADLAGRVIPVNGGEMLDSVRAGVAALPPDCDGAIVFPVDYALVSERSVRAVVSAVQEGHEVALPIDSDRPGHPIGLSRSCLQEVCGEVGSLRDVVAADPDRVHAVPVGDAWVSRDLDTPEDLAAARSWLRSGVDSEMAPPNLVLGRGQSADAANSLPSIVRRWIAALILGAVLCTFGYIVGVVFIVAGTWFYSQVSGDVPKISFVDPLQYPWIVILCFLASVYLAHRMLARKFRRWHDRCEFRAGSMRFLPRARGLSPERSVEICLADVGNLEFSPAEIRLHYGAPVASRRREVAVSVSPVMSEDDFERLEDHMREFAAGVDYSVVETNEPRYSRRWRIDEVFPWGEEVGGVDLDLNGEVLGRSELRAGRRQMTVEVEGESLLLRQHGEDAVTLELSAGRAWDARGMIVGVVEASTFRMTLRLGDGQVFEIQLEDQSVRSNGGRVGLIRTHNSMMSLTLDHPLPSPVAVLVVLARRGWDLF